MAGKEFKLSFVIGAIDNVTYKVMAINEKIAKMTKPFKAVGTALNDLGRESGLNKLGEKFAAVRTAAGGVGTAFKDILRTVGIVGAAAAGVFKVFVHGAFESIDAITDARDRLGFTTDTFQGLQFAAARAGYEIENLNPILTKFEKVVADARGGTGEAASVFQAFGISAKQLKTMKIDDILAKTGAGMSKITDPILRNRVAMAMFGKEGSKLAEVLADYPGALEDAKKAGVLIGPEALANTEKFKKSWGVITFTLQRLRDQVGSELFPVFIDMFQNLMVMINENREAIVGWAKAFAKDLPDMLRSFMSGLRAVITVIGALGAAILWVTDALGPTGVKFAVFALIIGKLIAPVWALVSGVGSLIAGFGGVAIKLLPLLGVFKALSLALLTTPIGWLVLGIAAIVAAVTNWDSVMSGLLWTWEKIKGIASTVGGWMGIGSGEPSSAASGPGARGAVLGPAMGAGNAVRTQAASSFNRNESRVTVDFSNVPTGTRVEADQTKAPVDLNVGMASMLPH